jgi:hypothetical protein
MEEWGRLLDDGVRKGREGKGGRTRISDMTGRKADVPADETKIVAVAVMPTMNVG